jgi:hypothetical protein
VNFIRIACRLSAGAEPNRDEDGAKKRNEELRNLISNREFANREWRSREVVKKPMRKAEKERSREVVWRRVKSCVRSPDRQMRREWRAHFIWVVDQDQRGAGFKFKRSKPINLKFKGLIFQNPEGTAAPDFMIMKLDSYQTTALNLHAQHI